MSCNAARQAAQRAAAWEGPHDYHQQQDQRQVRRPHYTAKPRTAGVARTVALQQHMHGVQQGVAGGAPGPAVSSTAERDMIISVPIVTRASSHNKAITPARPLSTSRRPSGSVPRTTLTTVPV